MTRSRPEKLDLFLLQMAGAPGVGKSTLAHAIARHTAAVVVDMDVIKSAALDSGTSWDMSGRVAYRASRAVAESLLEQGLSVILDSPCRFRFIVDGGSALAAKHNVRYAFIECVLVEEDELRRRMRLRRRQRSQRVALDKAPADAPRDVMLDGSGGIIQYQTEYPETRWLQVDTNEPVGQLIAVCLSYLEELARDSR